MIFKIELKEKGKKQYTFLIKDAMKYIIDQQFDKFESNRILTKMIEKKLIEPITEKKKINDLTICKIVRN